VLDPKTHQLQCEQSWWIFRKGTSQLVDFSEKHFAAGGCLLGGIDLPCESRIKASSLKMYLRIDIAKFTREPVPYYVILET